MATTKAPVIPDLVDETGAYIFRKSFTTKSGKKIVSKNGKPFKIPVKVQEYISPAKRGFFITDACLVAHLISLSDN